MYRNEHGILFLHYPSSFFGNLSSHARAGFSWNITKPRNQFNQDNNNNIYPEHQKTSGFQSSVWKTVISIDSWRSWSAISTNITIDIFISRSVKGNRFSTFHNDGFWTPAVSCKIVDSWSGMFKTNLWTRWKVNGWCNKSDTTHFLHRAFSGE